MAITRQSRELERGVERQIVLQVGPLVGIDVRPSRMFVWYGSQRAGMERIVSLDRAPRVLRQARPRRYLQLPGLEVSYLGNPAVTLALASGAWYRRLRAAVTGPPA
jgi:hypothetical protein